MSGPSDLDQPNYSLGPVSSEQFPELIATAIPADEGMVTLFGRVELLLTLDNRFYILSAVAALSDTEILLIKWYKPDEQYKTLARLPYSDVLSFSTNSAGLGRVIYLCLATQEFSWGDQSHAIQQRASMAFIKPSGFLRDAEKTEAALHLLQEKIKPVDGACDRPIEATEASLEAASR